MRRRSIFWALVLIVAGGLLLLDKLGVFAALRISAWGLIWPLILILMGVRLLLRIGRGRPALDVKEATIPLGNATRARTHCPSHSDRYTSHSAASVSQYG